MATITLELDDDTLSVLGALGLYVGNGQGAVDALTELAATARAGFEAPSSWQRSWLLQALGPAWLVEVAPMPAPPRGVH